MPDAIFRYQSSRCQMPDRMLPDGTDSSVGDAFLVASRSAAEIPTARRKARWVFRCQSKRSVDSDLKGDARTGDARCQIGCFPMAQIPRAGNTAEIPTHSPFTTKLLNFSTSQPLNLSIVWESGLIFGRVKHFRQL